MTHQSSAPARSGIRSPRRRAFRWLGVGAGVLAALAIAGCAALAHEEQRLTFRVVHQQASWFDGLPAEVQELDLAVPKGAHSERVHSWWWPGAREGAPMLLYLHGARWDLTGQLFRLRELHDFGFAILAIDYRGFGKSDGEVPSEESVYEDARVAWDWVVAHEPDPSRRYLYGHSLGSSVAIDLAATLSAATSADARVPLAGVIAESSFTNLPDLTHEIFSGWLPVGWMLTQKFDSLAKIASVRVPVLFVHGEADRFVPPRFSSELYAAAAQPKRLLVVPGATHNNSMLTGREAYRQAIAELFGVGNPEVALNGSAATPGK